MVNRRIAVQLITLSIPANTQFQIMVTSLQTPRTPATIDMNSLKVMVAAESRLTTIATSIRSRNQLSSMTFVPNSLHLVVNNYNPIELTAGTYSNPMLIKPSDSSTFLTNMLITFSSSTLLFLTNPTYMFLGNTQSSFLIGASQNLIPTTYTFNLIKK